MDIDIGKLHNDFLDLFISDSWQDHNIQINKK
jgi:hypothetical protein